MIEKLKKKFLIALFASVIVAVGIIYSIIIFTNLKQTNIALDKITDEIAYNNGSLPEEMDDSIILVSTESKKALIYFTVGLEETGFSAQLNHASDITEENAINYAKKALSKPKTRGWIGNYRYKIYKDYQNKKRIVFLDGSINKGTTKIIIVNEGIIMFSSGLAVFLILAILSEKIISPISESYVKQRQFITDVNHELKTPLTLINTNLEIIESETGPNEWIDDVKKETARMTELVNQLVTLSRMDESPKLDFIKFNLSDLLNGAVAEFKPLATDVSFEEDIAPDVVYTGNEDSIRRLVGIMLDNAIKYCDVGGVISIKLTNHHHPTIYFENTYGKVNEIDLSKLFDRFYRADKSRTNRGSFGIGLSLAKNITHSHKGDITCYKKDNVIGFKISLK